MDLLSLIGTLNFACTVGLLQVVSPPILPVHTVVHHDFSLVTGSRISGCIITVARQQRDFLSMPAVHSRCGRAKFGRGNGSKLI